MKKESIKIKHNKFLACPCCKKPMKIKFRFNGKDISIEPIHAYECSLCGEQSNQTKEVYHEKYDKDNPTKFTKLVCASCNDFFSGQKPGAKRGIRPSFRSFVEKRLKELDLN